MEGHGTNMPFLITVSPRNRFTVKAAESSECHEINYITTDWSRVCFSLGDGAQPFAFADPLSGFNHFQTCGMNFSIDIFFLLAANSK